MFSPTPLKTPILTDLTVAAQPNALRFGTQATVEMGLHTGQKRYEEQHYYIVNVY
jgi:hypothetical protein